MMTPFNGKLYMVAASTATGRELWQFDGTSVTLAAEANPGPTSGVISYYFQKLAILGGKIYFPGFTSATGTELMAFDGTNPPSLVADLTPGSGSGGAYSIRAVDGLLFFGAESPSEGTELYVYDGIGSNPAVFNLNPGRLGSNPRDFISFNNKVYFAAEERNTGNELWVYDPATNKAALAADIEVGGNSSSPIGFVVHNGKLYFWASTKADGAELWSFDGATATRVSDIGAGPYNGAVGQLVAYNNELYFSGNNSKTQADNYQLFKYNPVTGVSALVKVIDSTLGAPAQLPIVYKNKLYFVASTADAGFELWVHDGVTTEMVVDFNPGPAGAGIGDLVEFNGELYLSARKAPDLQPELYRLADVTTGLVHVGLAGEITAAPVPADGDATLQFNLKQAYRCRVTLADMAGRTLWQSPEMDFGAGSQQLSMPLREQPAGTYFYTVRGTNGVLASGRVVRR